MNQRELRRKIDKMVELKTQKITQELEQLKYEIHDLIMKETEWSFIKEGNQAK